MRSRVRSSRLEDRSWPRLFVTDRGPGEPVLVITGWTISSAVFDPWPSSTCRVCASSPTTIAAPALLVVAGMGLDADARRRCRARPRRPRAQDAHVVGLSMGAVVALELALRMPSRVAPGAGRRRGGRAATARPALSRAARSAQSCRTARPRRRGRRGAALQRFRDDTPTGCELMPPFAEHRAPPWTMGSRRSRPQASDAATLGRVRTPTLVLHGDQDVMSPPANARMLAEGIPGARLRLGGRGHAVPLERPEACAGLLLAWVGRHADFASAGPWRLGTVVERPTRPLALQAGTLRNTRDAATLVLRRLRRFVTRSHGTCDDRSSASG